RRIPPHWREMSWPTCSGRRAKATKRCGICTTRPRTCAACSWPCLACSCGSPNRPTDSSSHRARASTSAPHEAPPKVPPLVLAAWGVALACSAFVVAPLDLPAITVDATASGLFAGNVLFAIRATDYFASTTPSPFLHYWSLGVEEQFYLVWPLFLLLAFRSRR